jgi:hypothetical protein
MVGRLIEEENVGLRRHDAGQGSTAGFAAGEIVRPFLAGQAEMLHQIGGAVGIVGGSEPRLDIGADAGETIHVGHLRQVAHCCRRLAEHLAILRLDQSRSDLQQRRLARAVAADQSDLVARRRRQFRPVEQRRATEGQFYPVEIEKRRRHVSFQVGGMDGRATARGRCPARLRVGP